MLLKLRSSRLIHYISCFYSSHPVLDKDSTILYCSNHLIVISNFFVTSFQNFSVPEDLSGYDGLELRLKGDGRRYKLIIRTSSDWDTVGYTAGFDTVEGQWQLVSESTC